MIFYYFREKHFVGYVYECFILKDKASYVEYAEIHPESQRVILFEYIDKDRDDEKYYDSWSIND